MSDNMYDLTGWHKVECAASDDIRAVARSVSSSLTDPDGLYSDGVIFTEWALSDGEPILRDYRYVDERPCEHYERDGWDQRNADLNARTRRAAYDPAVLDVLAERRERGDQ